MHNLKKNDLVEVISGNHKGERGKILKIDREKDRVFVERVNLIKRHSKPSKKNQSVGGIVEKEGSIAISNVQLVCPKCSKKTRIGINLLEDGKRVRICKKCKENIDK